MSDIIIPGDWIDAHCWESEQIDAQKLRKSACDISNHLHTKIQAQKINANVEKATEIFDNVKA